MTDNKIQADARAKDGQIIERAQNRLKKAHSLKKRGGWRAVAADLDLNVRYVYDLLLILSLVRSQFKYLLLM